MAEKKQKLLTPVGTANWAYLTKPKIFTDDKGRQKGTPKYQIDVVFDPKEPAWNVWAGELKRAIEALPFQVDEKTGQTMPKQMPIKKEFDANDQPTGKFYVTFKTGEKFKPAVFDRYGKELPENVLLGNGSRVRVSYTTEIYTAFGGGITLYLNAVQVIDLVEYKSHDAKAFGFDVEAEPVGAAHSTAGGPPPQAEDDLPF
jgi:hypothetical protein